MKASLRKELKLKRAHIPSERKQLAAARCIGKLLSLTQEKLVLSFAPFKDEVNLWPLNEKLAKSKRLVLPVTKHCSLRLYQVTAPSKELVESSLGILEPNPSLCMEISPDKIEIAIIPGLGFDKEGHRIGYGKGCYDRLIPKLTDATKIGVGYKEQLIEKLPTDEHDQKLDHVLLY